MNRMRLSIVLAAIVSGVSFAGMGYAAYSVYTIHDWVGTSESPENWVGACLLLGFCTHFLLVAWCVQVVSKRPDTRVPGCLAIIAGIVSTIFFLSDLLGTREMVKEIPLGIPNESTRILVLLGMLTHATFYVTLASTLARAWRNSKSSDPAFSTASTEGLFISTNVAGAICALIGFGVMLVTSDVRPLTRHQQNVFVLIESAFILAPYTLIAGTWLWFAYRKAHLLDEKQRSDINRAGITTWLISVPLMFMMFLAQYGIETVEITTIWFPSYVFISLFVFSASSLWYYHKS